MISRRDLLKIIGVTGAAPAIGAVPAAAGDSAASDAEGQSNADRARPLMALTAGEAALLDAIVARLIPTDANGPGATEAQAVRYIDRALAGALKENLDAYRVNLAALDRYARSSRGAAFTSLSATDQDSVLIDVETGTATGAVKGWQGSSAAFFTMMRAHTWQGTFGDPFYGGNANFVGWDLLGYPGIRLTVTPDEQRLGAKPSPTHRSAYDNEMFNKAVARSGLPRRRLEVDQRAKVDEEQGS
jgi:gluconate 2-dehydrogenase gamma chain